MMSESWKFGSFTDAGSDWEAHERTGIAPYWRILSKGPAGNPIGLQGLEAQGAKGSEVSISESPLPINPWNWETAFMSYGGSVPVNWRPIQAPQYAGRIGFR